MTASTSLAFAPLLPLTVLAALAASALALVAYAAWQRARGWPWRAGVLALLLLVLAGPSVQRERREGLPDIAVIVADRSPSQGIADRPAATEAAVGALHQALAAFPDIEVRTVVVEGATDADAALAPDGEGTRLFTALGRALADVPRESLAGVFAVTDGQVHDVPDALEAGFDAPLHVLLTGRPQESDRRLIVEQAPAYGLVDSDVEIAVRIEDDAVPAGQAVRVELRQDDGDATTELVPVGETTVLRLRLGHAGTTVVELGAEARQDEITLANNRAVVAISGVRERLRVLLISGEAHTGERVWRSLLKADPGVDLVHFTILRPPEKQDGTPVRELALISFPVRELFELKLEEFDLIIFDRYRRRGIIPQGYLQNIAGFVRKGGALLVSAGPDFASPLSLYRTPIGDILPARPTGDVYHEGFLPALTDQGRRHPVTADLAGASPEAPRWGRWFRQVDVDVVRGEVLMAGARERPLLVLDRVQDGRVAELLSDNAWLWGRGFEGGGPQAELLRRVAHWLMKEPELEEDSLRAELRNGQLVVTRQTLDTDAAPVTVTGPTGEAMELVLEDAGRGRAVGRLDVSVPGLYRLDDGKRRALAAVGALNPLEWADLRATPVPLQAVADATGGGVRWLTAGGVPALRRVEAGRDAEGRDWLGVVRNRRYIVVGIDSYPFLPAGMVLALALGGLALAWRSEGR